MIWCSTRRNTNLPQITVSNIKIDVIHKDIKNVHLAVYPPNGRVRIAAPYSISNDALKLFAVSKLGWIRRRQRSFLAQARQTPREYKNRESHYYFGKRYLINVIEHIAPPQIVIRNKTYIDIYIRKGSNVEQIKSVMNEWYRQQLKNIVPQYIKKWEKIIGVSVGSFGIKQMKTKWGSCNIEAKRIWINLELAKKPIRCLEYIIVHEMIHLLERHHNERFLEYMNKYLPQWKTHKKELNRFPISHPIWEY